MLKPALICALLLAAASAWATPPRVDFYARTVDTGPLRVTFDLENPDRLQSIVLPAWDPSENLAGADIGGAVEFFGQSLRDAAARGFTTAYDLTIADWSILAETDSTVTIRASTQTLDQPPVRTDWTFRDGSAEVLVERRIEFSALPDTSAFQPFVTRMAFVANYRGARWRDGRGKLTSGVYCWDGCTETSWNGRWVEYFAREGDRWYSVALAPASSNPPYDGFVRSTGSQSYSASLSPLRPAGSHERDEMHRFLLRFSTIAGDTAVLDGMQPRLDAWLGPLAAPGPAAAALALAAAPNPSRDATRLAWTLPRAGRVTLEVLDVAGRRVALLADGEMAPGTHETRWNGTRADGGAVAPGVYLAVLRTPAGVTTRRLVRTR